MTAKEYEEMIAAEMHKVMKADSEAHKKKWGSNTPYKLNQLNGAKGGRPRSIKDANKSSQDKLRIIQSKLSKGATVREIAEEVRASHQSVSQLINKYGLRE